MPVHSVVQSSASCAGAYSKQCFLVYCETANGLSVWVDVRSLGDERALIERYKHRLGINEYNLSCHFQRHVEQKDIERVEKLKDEQHS